MPSRSMRVAGAGCLPAAACAAALSIALASRPRAQEAPPTLLIEHVIGAALDHNPDVRIARAAVDANRGALIESRRPFDNQPSASLSGSRTIDAAGDVLGEGVSTLGAETQFGFSRMFRSGIVVSSELATTRISAGEPGRTPFNQLAATSGLTVPLLRGRAGGLATAAERASSIGYGASQRTLRSVAASAVLRATRAYWDYHAARARAEIQKAAAQRSGRTVEEVKILIAADERPRSDIDLMLANAASKQATALDAQRVVVQARNALALAIGLDAADAATLPPPATALPNPEDTEPLPLEPLVAEALARHDELAAALARKQSADVMRAGAANQMRPRADVRLQTGYLGQLEGGGIGRMFAAGFRNVLGPNVSMQFLFEPSAGNSALRGALIQAGAASTQAEIAVEALRRTVRADVIDAWTALQSTRVLLASTREAVARSRLALATVQRNFELGSATLFDRILAEDTVTNAELADLSAHVQHATALADLQFARGVLVDGQGSSLTTDVRRVLRVSREDGR